ncbi:methylaspartate mutase [Nocardia sp. NPDC052566]|uniref:methylaspartate mutase n=1 Tax=Nocardia sp. NPDC052566 TaxID=3364330 RepID=UPI0037CA59CD
MPAGLAPSEPSRARDDLGGFVRQAAAARKLVIQPRMGFSDPAVMAAGLHATRNVAAATVGTLTLDSYTRTLDYQGIQQAFAAGIPINGYPLVTTPHSVTQAMIDDVGADFPIQVRHGSPDPRDIIETMIALGLSATEGGPVSYSLPYGRTPLRKTVPAWREACRRLADSAEHGVRPHLESFGGCITGQLCPPSVLIAVSVLEAMFFADQGLTSVSLSYAQQTNPQQDREALYALRRLAAELLPARVDWHVVLYTYMGVFPRTPAGAGLLLRRAAELALHTGTERLIVKTAVEASRIPSIADNVEAMQQAALVSRDDIDRATLDQALYLEARQLVYATLELHRDIGNALITAFERGYLDVPFCLHPDNRAAARSYLDSTGRLQWSDLGKLPLSGIAEAAAPSRMTSGALLHALDYVRRIHDEPESHEGALARRGR